MKHTIQKIITFLEYCIILFLIAFIVYFAYQKFILKNKTYGIIKYNFFVILSGSMEPTIKTKDLVVTHSEDSYKIGDIVAFRSNNEVVVHRIIDKEEKNGSFLFITKGDNNNASDTAKLSNNNIIGKYLFSIPILGSLILFFPANPLLIILLLIFIILIYLIIKFIRKEYAKSEENK